ncbi:uncharacterized protein L3040_003895 [Drepanopeziza brunnea f. sp. 'multigermtubi']|uniref:DUF410 domain protein n=1 Tax=Marssonina brunnea f. sp. multigermtubi (strain MB_m1) TaxID=1072389 RepID=K1XQK7_MARBU|nr:uncharacterized protein MBM_07100 [Drepanopeziza brunnea f. sp. 'multigermtubi' MB_m1]EKD14889.1 hypothetical protein MBM_07100 [Drepanopeziza brunnea f. sp. 'multigermtubi' MB_m1]KAJ5046661.1 hypothetical protein L3040_003895 [Drepanopeziza brunnea f. sp. 'multigermtubi']
MSGKIEKIIVRLQGKITEGAYYEAQQQTRVVAARYVKSESWPAAIDILFNVSQSLLKAGQGGSGGDLGLFLIDVYKQAGLNPDSSSKGKLLTLLRLFDSEEPTRKKFIAEMIGWSAKCGEYPAGEPELHHVAGSLYAEEHEAYEAERHLTLGTKDSPEVFAKLEYEWYTQDDSHTAALYAARVVFPYLLTGNVRDATKSLRLFTSRLVEANKGLAVQDVSSSASDMRIYPSLPLLNFLGLLLLAVQKGSAGLFTQLKSKYAVHIREAGIWDEALTSVAEMYFGIARPRQGNPLMDMMGSMFGGGGAGPAKPQPKRVGASVPAAEGLD